MLNAKLWRVVAVALWLIWAGHVYFNAYIFRCLATGVLAILASVAAVVLTEGGEREC